MAVRTVGVQEYKRRGPERVMRTLKKLKRSGSPLVLETLRRPGQGVGGRLSAFCTCYGRLGTPLRRIKSKLGREDMDQTLWDSVRALGR